MIISTAVNSNADARALGIKTKYEFDIEKEIGNVSTDNPITPLSWNLSNARSGDLNYNISEDTSPQAVFFKDNGMKMFVLGGANNTIYQYSLSTAWDQSTGIYDGVFFSVAAQDNLVKGLFFKDDGSKLYMIGAQNNTVYQYTLPTPWSLIGASYDSVSLSVSAEETASTSISFKSGGTKLYIVGTVTDTIYQYTLPTPWVLTGGSYDSVSLSVSEDSSPQGLFFKDDGTKVYMVGDTTNFIYQYTLPTPWVLTGASYDSISFDLTFQDDTPTGVYIKSDGVTLYMIGVQNKNVHRYTFASAWDLLRIGYGAVSRYAVSENTSIHGLYFKDDGTKMYVLSGSSNVIYQYSLSVAWDETTSTYDSISFSVGSQDTSPLSIFFKDDGTKFYVAGAANDTIYQYSCPTPWSLTGASYDAASLYIGGQDITVVAMYFKDDGTKFYMMGDFTKRVYQYSLPTPWDLTAGSFDSIEFGVSGQDATPFGLSFKADGAKFYVSGDATNRVYQYTLPTPWVLTGATYDGISFSTADQTINPRGLFMKSDGKSAFTLGVVAAHVYQYKLDESWEIGTTNIGAQLFNVGNQDGSPEGIFYKPDGTKMYLVGVTGVNVYEYSLAVPWDSRTAIYNSVVFDVSSQDITPRDVFFKNDGTKMYVLGDTNNTIYQYTLPTPWSLIGASYDSIFFSIGSEETLPTGFTFHKNGSKIYMVGDSSQGISQYSLPTPWSLTGASYDSVFLDVSPLGANTNGVFIKTDGTKLYFLGRSNKRVYQYTLLTPWVLTGASYDGIAINIESQDLTPVNIFIKPDGVRMYIVGSIGSQITQYSLGA